MLRSSWLSISEGGLVTHPFPVPPPPNPPPSYVSSFLTPNSSSQPPHHCPLNFFLTTKTPFLSLFIPLSLSFPPKSMTLHFLLIYHRPVSRFPDGIFYIPEITISLYLFLSLIFPKYSPPPPLYLSLFLFIIPTLLSSSSLVNLLEIFVIKNSPSYLLCSAWSDLLALIRSVWSNPTQFDIPLTLLLYPLTMLLSDYFTLTTTNQSNLLAHYSLIFSLHSVPW